MGGACSHGDMIYLSEKKTISNDVEPVSMTTKEDVVDCILAMKDGKILRQKDPQLYTPIPHIVITIIHIT